MGFRDGAMNEVVSVLAEKWDCNATGFIDVFIPWWD